MTKEKEIECFGCKKYFKSVKIFSENQEEDYKKKKWYCENCFERECFNKGFLAGQNSQKEKDLEMIEEIDNPQFISHYGDTQEKRLAILIYVKEFKKILKQKIGDGK